MKRATIFVFAVIFGGLILNSCATIESESEMQTQYYFYILFRISVEDHNSVQPPTETSFESVLAYMESLYRFSVEYIGSGTGITEDNIYDFLIRPGVSSEDIDASIAFLNLVGNNYFIFTFALDENYLIVLYIERM